MRNKQYWRPRAHRRRASEGACRKAAKLEQRRALSVAIEPTKSRIVNPQAEARIVTVPRATDARPLQFFHTAPLTLQTYYRAITMFKTRFYLLILPCMVAISGCTSLPPDRSDAPAPAPAAEPSTRSAEQTYWWYIRFQLHRDADDETQSFIDPLIADQLIAPILLRFEDRLPLWRFHRRWARDATGHQFSFIFYATVDTARRIRTEVESDPLLEVLRSANLLRQVVSDQVPSEQRARLTGTSDPGWPADIQREWPHFMMGASRMWLGMIGAEAAKRGDQPLIERYQSVEEALTETWFRQATHAFFHHLSALFGYKPVRVIRQEIMTF